VTQAGSRSGPGTPRTMAPWKATSRVQVAGGGNHGPFGRKIKTAMGAGGQRVTGGRGQTGAGQDRK
jgi:hypothetical protein